MAEVYRTTGFYGVLELHDDYFAEEGTIAVRSYIENQEHSTSVVVSVSKEQAPALALAVLEAAGYTENPWGDDAQQALHRLRQVVKHQAAAAQEAADKEALTAEAEALFEAFRAGRGDYALGLVPWDRQPSEVQQGYVALARKARELHLSPCVSEEAK